MARANPMNTTQLLVDRLRDHLKGRWESLDEEDLDAIEFARRHLRNVAKTARRSERDALGVDPQETARENEEAHKALVEILDASPWRALKAERSTYAACHYRDEGSIVVYAQSLEALLVLVESVETDDLVAGVGEGPP